MTEKIKKKLEEIWCQLEYLRINFSSTKNYPSSKSVYACMHVYMFACIHTCVCMYVCVYWDLKSEYRQLLGVILKEFQLLSLNKLFTCI